MNQQHKNHLKGGIHRYIEDVNLKVPGRFIRSFGKHDIDTIKISLDEWESKGYLKIIKHIEQCKDNEDCIEMLRYIDQKSPIKGFLNWEE